MNSFDMLGVGAMTLAKTTPKASPMPTRQLPAIQRESVLQVKFFHALRCGHLAAYRVGL